jgi:thioredoxin 1
MSAHPIEVSDTDFQSKVLASGVPVVVDFWAPWCGPCRMVAPILEDLAGEFAGKLLVAKVNTDEHSQYAQRFGVQGIPTLIFFAGGHEVDRVVGALPKVVLRGKFQNVLAQLPATART